MLYILQSFKVSYTLGKQKKQLGNKQDNIYQSSYQPVAVLSVKYV